MPQTNTFFPDTQPVDAWIHIFKTMSDEDLFDLIIANHKLRSLAQDELFRRDTP